MISFFHCTLFAALALLSLICIKASPAPPSFCSALFSTPSSWSSGKLISPYKDDGDPSRNLTLTLFKQSSLPLQQGKNETMSFTFTSDEDEQGAAPAGLAFIVVRFSEDASPSAMQTMELPVACNPPKKIVHLCDRPDDQRLQIPSPNCSPEQDPDESSETRVSLTYNADAAEIRVKVAHNHTTVTFTASISPSDEESTQVFVGYITSGEASISNVTSVESSANSHHKKVVEWVIVGVSTIAFLMGLLILVLFIRKRHGHPSSLITSRPAGHATTPPSAPTTRAPFPYHDLESSPTPMWRGLPPSPPYKPDAFQISGTPTPMWRGLPPSPPYKPDAFQISGTASWLKQTNPR